MEDKWRDTLKDLMEIPRIKKRVLELNLTNEEAIQALPILLEMSEEKEDTNALYLTSFERNEFGHIKKILVLSKEGKRKEYLNNILTQQFYSVDFEEDKEFEKREERKILVNEFAKFIKEDSAGIVERGFFIFGPHDAGKTFTLKLFARMLAERGRKIGFVNAAVLVSLFQTAFSRASSDDVKQELIDTLKNVDYLFIDDIGGESVSTWFRDDILFQILTERSANRKGTFFSSNYSYEELKKVESKTIKEKYLDTEKAERIISRIKSLTIPFELKSKSK